MTGKADHVGGLEQIGVIGGAMDVMAAEASDAAGVHNALHEVVTLHAVLVAGPVGKVGKTLLAGLGFFQVPKVLETQPLLKSDWPSVVLPRDQGLGRPPLRMALDAGVIGLNVIQARRIDDVGSRGSGDVIASGAVALFAAHVPLRDGLGLGIVVHGVAAIA